MNIFYLDTNPRNSAHYHCDSHIRKMLIEYAKILSVGHWTSKHPDDIDRAIEFKLYKPMNITNPLVKWCNSSALTYTYLFTMWEELQIIYEKKYGKLHVSNKLYDVLLCMPHQILNKKLYGKYSFEHDMIPPPMSFGREWSALKKGVNPLDRVEVVGAYRNYYRTAKNKIAKWGKGRKLPHWWLKLVS